MIKIKKRIVDAIYRHAQTEFPNECCGIVIGKKVDHSDFEQIFPCRNLQNEMHANDPEKFPRTAETAYFLSPDDLFKIQKIARNLSMEMKMIYHSHVNVGSYFSEEDKKQATLEGNPVLPGIQYLVVDIKGAGLDKKDLSPVVSGAKLFGWDNSKKDFTEMPWEES